MFALGYFGVFFFPIYLHAHSSNILQLLISEGESYKEGLDLCFPFPPAFYILSIPILHLWEGRGSSAN